MNNDSTISGTDITLVGTSDEILHQAANFLHLFLSVCLRGGGNVGFS